MAILLAFATTKCCSDLTFLYIGNQHFFPKHNLKLQIAGRFSLY